MKANFRNLKSKLESSSEAVMYARQYKNSNIIEYSLYTIGGLAAAVGGVAAIAGEPKIALAGISLYLLATGIATYLNIKIQPKKIRLAITSYNK